MRTRRALRALILTGSVLGAALVACTEDDGTNPNPTAPFHPAGGGATVVIANDAGQALMPFTAPADPGAGGVLFSASGEVLALSGLKFPPDDPTNDTYMVDGWDFQLEAYITVFDHITLWDAPNLVPTDQSKHGAQVAHADGPWVADLHKGGALPGKGGDGEQATPIAVLRAKDDGSPFESTVAYAFGFSTVPAPADYAAYNVNLDATQAADYAFMAASGYSVLYVGTATFKGTGCTQTRTNGDPGLGPDAGAYDYAKLPPAIHFRLGFSTPTAYVNCQNGTDLSGPGVNGEEHPRGIQIAPNAAVIAQATIHMDHPFWESFAEGSPLHWDAIAGRYLGATGVPEAHTEDLRGVDFLAFTDRAGAPMPWRNCAGASYQPPGTGQMNFDPLNVPVDPNAADPSKALRDYYDYIRYTQASQGHLNSQGQCFVDRHYPAPGSTP